MITTITEKNSGAFANLVPPEILRPVDAPGHYCLGVLRQDKEGYTAAGVLVFEVKEGSSMGEAVIAAVIRWLYVAQDCRNMGMGNELMEELYRILNRADVEHVLCDVPFPEEYNLLCAFLENWGFTFELTDSYEITAPLKRFEEHPSFAGRPAAGSICPVRVLDKTLWDEAMRKAQKCKGRPSDLSADRQEYDNDVSCVRVEGRQVTALFLVRCDGGGRLVPMLLRNLSGAGGGEIIYGLLSYAIHTAVKKYGPDVPVHVECLTKESADLIAYFFPKAQPPLVRRGVYTGEGEQAQE